MSAYRPPYPVPGVIWASLPVPALLKLPNKDPPLKKSIKYKIKQCNSV